MDYKKMLETLEGKDLKNFVKEMSRDNCICVSKTAMEILVEYGEEDDYKYLLMIAEKGKEKQRFFALYYLCNLVYSLDLDEERWMEDVKKIADTLSELEKKTIEERYSFSLFLEMEIRKNLKKPKWYE